MGRWSGSQVHSKPQSILARRHNDADAVPSDDALLEAATIGELQEAIEHIVNLQALSPSMLDYSTFSYIGGGGL